MQVIRTTGGRKTAIARIGLKTGKGNIEINKKPFGSYKHYFFPSNCE